MIALHNSLLSLFYFENLLKSCDCIKILTQFENFASAADLFLVSRLLARDLSSNSATLRFDWVLNACLELVSIRVQEYVS